MRGTWLFPGYIPFWIHDNANGQVRRRVRVKRCRVEVNLTLSPNPTPNPNPDLTLTLTLTLTSYTGDRLPPEGGGAAAAPARDALSRAEAVEVLA